MDFFMLSSLETNVVVILQKAMCTYLKYMKVMFFNKFSVQIIREFCNATVADRYGITMGPSQLNILWSIIVSIFLVGGVTGSLSGGWVADRFGR
jgi:MFS family permease